MNINIYNEQGRLCVSISFPNDSLLIPLAGSTITFFGEKCKAHTSLSLTTAEVCRIIEYFSAKPGNADVIIKNDRMLMEEIMEEVINCEVIPFLRFKVYDHGRNNGHVEVDFNLKCITIEMTRNEDHNKDFAIDRDDSSENIMLFQLDLHEKDKDEYYYGGHIALNSPFFSMDSAILIDNYSAAQLKKDLPVLQEEDRTINFCPLGECIDVQFTRKGASTYAFGSVFDFGHPMLGYYFNHKIEGHIFECKVSNVE